MKKRASILILAFLFTFAPMAHSKNQSFRLVIPKAKLQSGVSKLFPVSKDYFLLTVVVSNPALQLKKGSDKLGLGFDLRVKSPQFGSLPGTGAVEGGLRYDKRKGALFMDRSKVTKFDLKGLPSEYNSFLIELLGSVVKDYLAQKPLYEIKGKKKSERLLKAALQSIRIENGQVVALVNIPAGALAGAF